MQMIPSLDCMVDFTWPIHSYKSFCEIVNTLATGFFFANILPKYFFNLSKDLSFPLRVNIVKSLKTKSKFTFLKEKSYYQLSMFWHFIYKAGHHINSTSLVALPSPCPTIREVFDDGHFLLTPCSCTLFFTWAISTSAERGYSFYLHLRGCSHKTAWPGQMTPPLHPGLPGSYQSQRVCENFFLWDSGSSAGTCGKPVSHYSLVLSLSQWSMQSTFWYLVAINFHPSPWKKNKNKIFNMFTNNMILLLIVILNTRSKSNPCNFLMENSLIWNP